MRGNTATGVSGATADTILRGAGVGLTPAAFLYLGALVVFRRGRGDTELFRKVTTLLADLLVVAHEHVPEIPDLLRRPALGREHTGLDVGRVCRVEDRDDRRIIER